MASPVPIIETDRLAAGSIRPEIAVLLARLKRKIRAYVLAEGSALLLVLAAGLFWATLAIDWTYFRLTALELPLWFRKTAAVGALCALAAGVLLWLAFRLFARFRAKGLALVLERRFPELEGRLITAVEIAGERSSRATPLSAAMVDRTVEEAVRASAALPLDVVFDRSPLRKAVIAAVLLLTSVTGLAVASPSTVQRWGNAFISWKDGYWPRETRLVVRAIVQPGDRVREFRDGELKHPRGVDLILIAEAADGTRPPANVELYYELDSHRGGGRVEMTKSGSGQFRHVITSLLESASFWVRGGDFASIEPLRVIVVEPPRIDAIELDCDYPDYTGMDAIDADGKPAATRVAVQAAQVALPVETAFELHAAFNKPLETARIRTDVHEFVLSYGLATVASQTANGQWSTPQSLHQKSDAIGLSDDGLSCRLPLRISGNAAMSTGETVAVIAPDSRLRFELEDRDGVISAEPTRFVIHGILDEAPIIQTELRGISQAITRKASIPAAGTIEDDYGLMKGRFDYRIDDEKEWRPRPFRKPPEPRVRRHELKRDDAEAVERFEILPLDLALGQKITLAVFAEDGDNINGPHEKRGQEFTFQVVSDEELLSQIYVREVNLRERLDKLISELERVQKDLVDHRTQSEKKQTLLRDASSNRTERDAQVRDIETSVAVCAVRSLHQVRKNAVETASIEESFHGILDELVNNAIATPQMVERLRDLIIRPLRQSRTDDFPAADQAVGLFKLAVDRGENPLSAIDDSSQAVAAIVSRLKLALGEMEELVKFHEAVNRLKAIVDEQQRISEQTRQEQKNKRLKELRDLELP